MKKLKLVPLSLLFFGIKTFSQIGLNTTAPAATLDIVAKNATGASTDTDGLVIPRIDRLRAQSMTGMTTSTLIYVNNISTGTAAGTAANINSVGFYYYDGTLWAKLDTVGDTTIDAFVNDPANTMVKLGTNADGSTARTAGTDFVVKDTGFVGLGTSTPSTQLDINSAFSNASLTSIGNATQKLLLGVSTINNGPYLTTASGTNNSLRLGVNGAEHIRIDARTATLGNVGIGTGNTAVNYPLTINRLTGVDTYMQLATGNTGIAATDGLKIGISGTTGNTLISNQEATNFSIFNNNVETITILPNNNVGIGTTSPTTKLDVVSAGGSKTAFRMSDGSEGVDKQLTSDSAGKATWKDPTTRYVEATYGNTGVTVPVPNLGVGMASDVALTIPPGKWLITINGTVKPYVNPSSMVYNGFYFMALNSYGLYLGIFIGVNSASAQLICNANLIPGSNFANFSGSLIYNNATAGDITLYPGISVALSYQGTTNPSITNGLGNSYNLTSLSNVFANSIVIGGVPASNANLKFVAVKISD